MIEKKKQILLITSSMFTDRILKYSNLVPVLLDSGFHINIWATSLAHSDEKWFDGDAEFINFPEVSNFKERINYLRRFNELLWAYKLNAISILSMKNFNEVHKTRKRLNLLSWIAKSCKKTKINEVVDKLLLLLFQTSNRSLEVRTKLLKNPPDLIIIMNPFWLHESAVAIEAIKLGIPIFSFIPSWDNITTKSRLTYESVAYSVWSQIRVDDLTKYYPSSVQKSIYVIGAPQYDVFFNETYFIPKDIFFANQRWDTQKKVVLYCLGSPNFIHTEYEGALRFAQSFHDAELNSDYQLVIRPHPNKDNNELVKELAKYPEIKVQYTKQEKKITEHRTQDIDDIKTWVNSFRYADVVINLSSTVIFDALLFDKEVINIDFDPGSAGDLDDFIKEINRTWVHLKPLFKHPGIYYAENFDDIICRLKFLAEGKAKTQTVHKQELLKLVCEFTDGKSADRFAEAIKSELAKQNKQQVNSLIN